MDIGLGISCFQRSLLSVRHRQSCPLSVWKEASAKIMLLCRKSSSTYRSKISSSLLLVSKRFRLFLQSKLYFQLTRPAFHAYPPVTLKSISESSIGCHFRCRAATMVPILITHLKEICLNENIHFI